MRGRWITAGCFVVLAAGAAVCALQPVARPARKYDIAPYDELTEKIRAGLEGTTSRCELGPPSAEDQEGWKQLQEPRKLGRHSLTDLLREPDEELSLEVYSRLLDELWSTGLGAMTEPERNVALLNELQAEVVNGGFHQLLLQFERQLRFENSRGVARDRQRAFQGRRASAGAIPRFQTVRGSSNAQQADGLDQERVRGLVAAR